MAATLDHLIFTPGDVDLSRSPLAGRIDAETYVLGAFNPGLTRLANGNLLMMVRVAEALRQPQRDGHVHAIRWDAGDYGLDAWPLDEVDTSDPRTFTVPGRGGADGVALTSISWLLPVELDAEGVRVQAVHYDRAIAPGASYQCYGVEDARISRVGQRYWMTTCGVSAERQCSVLYSSEDALDWRREGIVLDHQNKDMLIFEGLIDGHFWAETRPIGDGWFAYPPDSEWRPGPSINLASSPDALHWKPCDRPFIRPRAAGGAMTRIGGGAPPVLTQVPGIGDCWLTLWHGVESNDSVGTYRTYWSLLDAGEPWRVIATGEAALLEPKPSLTAPLRDQMYLSDIVFTTGLADGGDHWIIASGEADLACRITHIPKSTIGPR